MIPPLSQKLTQEEKDACRSFALWLQGSVNARDPSPTEKDAWNTWRWVKEQEAELEEQRRLFELGKAWTEKI